MSWSEAQRRMVALGYYGGRIDGDPGGDDSNTLAGVEKLLDLVEKATGVAPPKPIEVQPAVSGNFPLPKGFDPDYKWLGTIGTLPRILQEFILMYGISETPGAKNSPIIMGWAKEIGGEVEKVYTADSIPFCGLGMAVAVKRAGYHPVAQPLWARNWDKFGVSSVAPSLGDILTFQREGGGHVGVYVGEDSTHYHVLGTNQSDSTNIMRIAKGRMKAHRRPAYKNALPSWKPYKVSSAGAAASTNEA